MFSSDFNLSEFGRSGTAPINKPKNAALLQAKSSSERGTADATSAVGPEQPSKGAGGRGGLRRPKTTTENISDNVLGDLNRSLRLNRLHVSSDRDAPFSQTSISTSEADDDEGKERAAELDYERKFAQMIKTNDYNNAKESLSCSSSSSSSKIKKSPNSKSDAIKNNSWISSDGLNSANNQSVSRVTTNAKHFVHKKIDYSLYLDSEILNASSSGRKARSSKKLSSSLGSSDDSPQNCDGKKGPAVAAIHSPLDSTNSARNKSSNIATAGDLPSSEVSDNKNSPTTRSDTAAQGAEGELKIVGDETPPLAKSANRPLSRKLYQGSRKSKNMHSTATGSHGPQTGKTSVGAPDTGASKSVSLSANSRLRHKSYSTEYLLHQDDAVAGGSNNNADGSPYGSAGRSFRRNNSYGGTSSRSANSIYSRSPYAEYRPPSRQSSAFPTHLADRPSRDSSRGSAYTDDDFLISEEGARGSSNSASGPARGGAANNDWSRGGTRETTSSDSSALYGYSSVFHNPADDGFTVLDSCSGLPFEVKVSDDSPSHTWRAAHKQPGSAASLDAHRAAPAPVRRRSLNELRYGGLAEPSPEAALAAAGAQHQATTSAAKQQPALHDDDVGIYSDDSSGEYELEKFDAKGLSTGGHMDLETSLDTDFLSLFAN